MFKRFIAAAAILGTAMPAYAGDKYVVQPLPIGQVTARFYKGQPTVTLVQKDGMVQIVPLPFDHGSISFKVAVFNDAEAPSNMDLSNLTVSVDGKPVGTFTREQLERKAKNRAMWAQIAVGVAGAAAAAAAASQRDTYHATTYTPHGTYSTYVSAPSPDAQLQAGLLAAGAGASIYLIQKRLDQTLDALGDQIVQTTTVDGRGGSYAGRVVLQKVQLPQKGNAELKVVVRWNGIDYPFLFQVARSGTPMPRFENPPAPNAAPLPDPAATEAKSTS